MKRMMEKMVYKVNEIAETVAATLIDSGEAGHQIPGDTMSNPEIR